jgi:LPS export ABC transporter protein LptC
MKPVLASVVVMLLFSCSLDYSQGQLTDELSEDIPDTVLLELQHVIVRDATPRFRVAADRAETYSERNRQYLHNVEFTEYGPDQSVVTNGTADYAEYQIDTEDVELTGNLRFYSQEEDAWLTADYLYWDSDARRLTSEPEQPVSARRADGTTVSGRGFVAEMSTSSIYFQRGVSGTIVQEDE